MTTVPHSGPSDPDPDPLSAREQRILSGIEADLAHSAPQLVELSDSLRSRRPLSTPKADRLLQLLAILVIVLLVVPAPWLQVLALVAIMLGLPLAAVGIGRRGTGDRREPERDD